MREIALHILDIAENGIGAGANRITIFVNEARKENLLTIVVEDNGKGIPREMLDKVIDPFFTSRTTRRIGMGLSLFKAAAERCDGSFNIESEVGKGTRTTASFRYDHIDRAPMGDMAATIMTLIVGHPEVDFVYTHIVDGESFSMDTVEMKQEMNGLSLTDAAVFTHLTQSIRKGLETLSKR